MFIHIYIYIYICVCNLGGREEGRVFFFATPAGFWLRQDGAPGGVVGGPGGGLLGHDPLHQAALAGSVLRGLRRGVFMRAVWVLFKGNP